MMTRRELVQATLAAAALVVPFGFGCTKPADTPAGNLERKIVPPAGVVGENGKQQKPQKTLAPAS
jgi:hypothetical protein